MDRGTVIRGDCKIHEREEYRKKRSPVFVALEFVFKNGRGSRKYSV